MAVILISTAYCANQMLNKATMIRNRLYGANNLQVKIGRNAVVAGWKSIGVEARNTYTSGAEAGELNEMK